MIEELYWQDNEYIKWKLEFLQNNTFSNSDIEALYYKGLPEWAAPNMYFFHSSKTNNGELIIGEDRNDRKIYMMLRPNKFTRVKTGYLLTPMSACLGKHCRYTH